MSQSSGNSPIDRVVAWFKGLFGSGQSATDQPTITPPPATDSTATTLSATEPVTTTLSATDAAATTPSSTTTQQVDRANDAMRDRARDLVRPLEDEASDAASAASAAAAEASDTATAATDAAASQASDAVSTAKSSAASTQARVDEINNDLRERARNLVRPLESESEGDLAGTSDLPGDVGEAATAAAAGQPTGASSDEFAAGGYTPDPVTATDVEQAAEGDVSQTDSASAASGSGPAPVEDASIDSAGEGTYAATAGDIVTDGPSTGDDLGLVDDGDLDATERGALENAEDAQLTHLPGSDRPTYGSRTGADFSRTGFHAGMRGEEADAFVAGNTDAPTTYESTTADTAANDSSSASSEPSASSVSDTQSTSESTGEDDGPGNTAMTAGDDYSAERSAEELPGVAQVSTTTADIGQEMASGEEADDLVGEPPAPHPPSGVAVQAEPTDEVSTGGSTYAGAVRGDGTANTPDGYPVKGNGSSMIYHTPEMPSYQATKAEWCFATVEDAEQAGFRPPRRYQTEGNDQA